MRKQDYYEPSIGRESEPRRRPKKKKKRANRGERAVVTLLSLLFLTVAIVATVKYVVRAPEPVTNNEDQQTQQDGTAEDSDAIQTISNGKERKKYCYTILAYGVDNDAGGSDTNMLVRFDAENKKIDVVSLPRDTLMSNGRKLNSSYNNGGTEKLRSNIEDMLGVPVDFYVSVDLKGFIALIDQIGGVDFDVPEDMDYDDPYQDLHIHFKAGLQHLSGQQSMEVVRFRHNSDKHKPAYGGRQDIGRIGTQQAFLKTVAQKLMKIENVPAMAETFLKYVKTDLTLGNLVWLANQALSMGGTDAISFATLPGDGAGWYNGSVYIGHVGNVVLAGHNHTYFYNLPKCKKGDEVTLETSYVKQTYMVTDIEIFHEDDQTYVRPTDDDRLTMYTCWNNGMLGMSEYRIAVICELTDREWKEVEE